MSAEDFTRFDSLKLYMHQIYELQKGVRHLVLGTMTDSCADIVRARLDEQGIGHLTQRVDGAKVNLYFGDAACLDAVRTFVDKPLSQLTPAEDFMLGAMLGYDICQQCRRYCSRRNAAARTSAITA